MVMAAAEDGQILLSKVQNVVIELISSSESVKSFVVRWTMIKSRLEQLPSLLQELGSSSRFSKNKLCTDMLESMSKTLDDCISLVSVCTLPSYSGGKLQMQSRLDTISRELDVYLHDCRVMLSSGVLKSSPVAGVTKESKKWTVKDLLTKLQMGSPESRAQSLDSLVEFMSEDDKNILLVAASPRSIPTLVHLLDSRIPAIREKAACAVLSLAGVEVCTQEMVKEGVLHSLVRLLDPARSSTSPDRAAKALQSLTISAENARSVAAHGGILPLLELCKSGTPAAQEASAGVLRNLSTVEELRSKICEEEDAAEVIIYLLGSGTLQTREHAAVVLQNLMKDRSFSKEGVVSNGGLEAIARFMDVAEAPSAQEAVIGILQSLGEEQAYAYVISEAGFLSQLVVFMNTGSPTVQQCAAAAVGEFARCTETRRLVGESGCIPPLVKMLDAKTQAAQEQAVTVLAGLLELESNRRILITEEKGIAGLVNMLDGSKVAAERAVVALSLLAGSSKVRKQITTCGACYYLGKLVDKEVSGAKKLLEKLEGGRLKTLLKKLDLTT